MSDKVAISREEVMAGMEPVMEAFVGQSSEYADMSRDIFEVVLERKQYDAVYIPAVKFVMDCTLGIITQPEVEARLPKEIAHRRNVAIHFGQYAVSVAVAAEAFMRFYAGNKQLKGLLPEIAERLGDPENTDFIEKLGLAPFFDASVVSGGALNYLNEQSIEEDPADVIGRSRALLAISGVDKREDHLGVVFAQMGLPYAGTQHYRHEGHQEGTKLAFTQATLDLLEAHKGSGCPSGDVALPSAPDTMVLEEAWQRLTEYLVPQGATALEL